MARRLLGNTASRGFAGGLSRDQRIPYLPRCAMHDDWGLAIANHLVVLMGGTIKAASAPEEGSTFTFDLSLPFLPELEAVANQGAKLSGVWVLVVVGHQICGFLTTKLCAGWGMRVEEASTGEAPSAWPRPPQVRVIPTAWLAWI